MSNRFPQTLEAIANADLITPSAQEFAFHQPDSDLLVSRNSPGRSGNRPAVKVFM